MEAKEKGASPAKTKAPDEPNTSMTQTARKNKSNKGRHILNANQRVRQVAFKFYDEQLPNRLKFEENIRDLDSSKYQVLAIRHDRDIVSDGIWENSVEKPHYHVIFRLVNVNSRMTVVQIMEMLGIVFRRGIDDVLWANHGVETVQKFAAYATYLTHDTEQSVNDGKEHYELEELISNLTIEEIKQVREGYIRLSAKRKYTEEEMAALDKEAYDLGYSLGDFEEWFFNLPFSLRRKSDMKPIKEHYQRGIEVRLREDTEVIRCCIFITSEGNKGKTYTSRKSLESIGISNSDILLPSDGSGKFDKLKPTHKAIVIDDMPCPNMLNMSDNRFCSPYRRNSGNPVWTGQYLIITSNRAFDDYIDDNGIIDKRQIEALHTRFFECDLVKVSGHTCLRLLSPSTRGKRDEQLERYGMFNRFRQEFNKLIYDYIPTEETVDYEALERVNSPVVASVPRNAVEWFNSVYSSNPTRKAEDIPIQFRQDVADLKRKANIVSKKEHS